MSLPKFNLSKLKESVSRQQKATRQDIQNLLLLDRLQAEVANQRTKSKSRNAGSYDYKVTIRGFDYVWMGVELAFTIEFKRRVGEDDFGDLNIETYEDSYGLLEYIIGFDDNAVDSFDEDENEDEQSSVGYYLKKKIEPKIKEEIISSTLNDNLKRFEVRHFMEDESVNSWSTDTTEGNDLFGGDDPDDSKEIIDPDFGSIEIERL